MAVSVLIVDDDPAFRRLVAGLLSARGYVVAGEAGDAAAALEAASRLRPDAVLVDIGLPDLDGFTLARRLVAAQPRLRVVLTSSDSYVSDPGEAAFIGKTDLVLADLRPYLG